ncbi:hypothetical protein M3Y94_01299500 [Aphelenchoides besseyi]|nr:hypothetical protein M3Y94_01299500 [Aphelenchoides besseyi]KAI6220153.1 hypothetical protein M3Y95_01054800 [Aphelenchoides besseyi]
MSVDNASEVEVLKGGTLEKYVNSQGVECTRIRIVVDEDLEESHADESERPSTSNNEEEEDRLPSPRPSQQPGVPPMCSRCAAYKENADRAFDLVLAANERNRQHQEVQKQKEQLERSVNDRASYIAILQNKLTEEQQKHLHTRDQIIALQSRNETLNEQLTFSRTEAANNAAAAQRLQVVETTLAKAMQRVQMLDARYHEMANRVVTSGEVLMKMYGMLHTNDRTKLLANAKSKTSKRSAEKSKVDETITANLLMDALMDESDEEEEEEEVDSETIETEVESPQRSSPKPASKPSTRSPVKRPTKTSVKSPTKLPNKQPTKSPAKPPSKPPAKPSIKSTPTKRSRAKTSSFKLPPLQMPEVEKPTVQPTPRTRQTTRKTKPTKTVAVKSTKRRVVNKVVETASEEEECDSELDEMSAVLERELEKDPSTAIESAGFEKSDDESTEQLKAGTSKEIETPKPAEPEMPEIVEKSKEVEKPKSTNLKPTTSKTIEKPKTKKTPKVPAENTRKRRGTLVVAEKVDETTAAKRPAIKVPEPSTSSQPRSPKRAQLIDVFEAPAIATRRRRFASPTKTTQLEGPSTRTRNSTTTDSLNFIKDVLSKLTEDRGVRNQPKQTPAEAAKKFNLGLERWLSNQTDKTKELTTVKLVHTLIDFIREQPIFDLWPTVRTNAKKTEPGADAILAKTERLFFEFIAEINGDNRWPGVFGVLVKEMALKGMKSRASDMSIHQKCRDFRIVALALYFTEKQESTTDYSADELNKIGHNVITWVDRVLLTEESEAAIRILTFLYTTHSSFLIMRILGSSDFLAEYRRHLIHWHLNALPPRDQVRETFLAFIRVERHTTDIHLDELETRLKDEEQNGWIEKAKISIDLIAKGEISVPGSRYFFTQFLEVLARKSSIS